MEGFSDRRAHLVRSVRADTDFIAVCSGCSYLRSNRQSLDR